MKTSPKLIGKNLWFCKNCLEDNSTSDPMKDRPTPHCTDCGKHHPIHRGCKGENLAPAQIDYIQLFYMNIKPEDSLGVA